MEETKNEIPIKELLAQNGVKRYSDWGNLSAKEQVTNRRILRHLINSCVRNKNINTLIQLWADTDRRAQVALKPEFFVCFKQVVCSLEGNFNLGELLSNTSSEMKQVICKDENWEHIINIIKENTTTKSNTFAEREEAELNGENIKNNYYEIVSELLAYLPKEMQLHKKDFILEFFNQSKGHLNLSFLWKQIECKEELSEEVYNITKENSWEFAGIFEEMPYAFQKEKLEEVNEIFAEEPMILWGALSEELQREEWETYKERYNGDLEKLVKLFSRSKHEIQNEHMDLLNDLIIQNKSNIQNILNLWFGIIDSTDVQNEKWQEVLNIIETDRSAIADFWRFTSEEIKRDNFVEIFSKYKNDIEIFSKLWEATDEQPKYFGKIIALCDNDLEKETAIWNNTNKFKQTQKLFDKIYNDVKGNGDLLASMWSNTSLKLQKANKEKLSEIMELSKTNPANSTIILNNTLKSLLTKEDIKMLVQTAIGAEQDIEKAMALYGELENINPDTYKTINLQMLSPKFRDIFDKEQLIKLSVDIDIQEKIAKYSNQPICLDIIKYISNNSQNWGIELNDIVSKLDSYENLLNNINQEELNNEEIQQLISCLSDSKNFFNTQNIEDVKNFNERRKSICMQILDGQDVSDKMSKEFQEYTPEQRKIFAMLELAYGIDIQEASNIVYEYGTDIEEIVPKNEEEGNLVNTIKAIKIILNSKPEDIEAIYQNNKENIQGWKDIKYSSIANIEAEALQLYTRIYNEANKIQEKQLPSTEYKGANVEVAEIEGDFFANVRVEGAYSEWSEPEDYNEYLEQVYPKINGNCTSFVASNLFARARPKGPTFVYGSSEEYPLELLAPWDIVSAEANATFSPGSANYDFKNGIQFRVPQKQIDNTRHNHNEAVKRKWHYDEQSQKMVKEKPSRVLYVQESINQTEEEREADPQWRMAKKAAAQLGIKISVLNLEKNLQLQEQKMEEVEKIFLGEKENKGNLTSEQMIERLIVEFENNRVTMRFVNNDLKNKFFTDEKRDKLYNMIENKIKEVQVTNSERAEELLQAYTQVLQSEMEKAYTNTGKQIHDGPDFEYIKNRLASSKSQELSKEDMQSKKLQEIYRRYDINLSDIEFINKVFERRTKEQESRE